MPYDSFGTTTFGNVDREVNSETFMLRYGYNPLGNDLIDLTAQLSYANEEIMQTAVVPGNPLLDADHQYETTTLTLKNRARFDTGALGHSLVTGVELINRKRLNASSAPGGEDDRWAVFAVDEIQIGEAWTVTPALRYESSTIQGSTAPNDGRYSNDALMGGLSLRYAFGNGWSVFGSAAYTEVLPPIDDLDNIARVTQSEKSRTYEIGAAYERRDAFRAGDSLSFKINAYDTKLWDVTSFVSTTIVGGIPVFTDLDEINTQGIEIEASYALENGLYMDANLNIADGSETTAAQIEQDWRNQAANSARLTLGKKIGETYDFSWEAVAADDITVNGVRSSGYVTHNLRATIAPQNGVWAGTEFRIGVENLFDKQYQPHLSTRAATGRNVKLTLAKTF